MKKLITTLLLICFCAQCCLAAPRKKAKQKPEPPAQPSIEIQIKDDDIYSGQSAKYQKRLMEVGFRLLNANGIEKRTTFYYLVNKNKKPCIKLNASKKHVFVNENAINFLESDDELAALISQQIAYSNEIHQGLFRRITIGFSPRKYEKKSDTLAVDYMVKAGYNPVAMIITMNKLAGEPDWYDPYIMHHKGSVRLAYIYQYIYEKYPMYLIDNEYLTNIYFQNFLLTSKKDRAKVRKLQQERLRLKKLKNEQKEEV